MTEGTTTIFTCIKLRARDAGGGSVRARHAMTPCLPSVEEHDVLTTGAIGSVNAFGMWGSLGSH